MTVIYMNRSRQSKKDPNRHTASAAPGFCYGTETLKCLEGHEVEGMAAYESDLPHKNPALQTLPYLSWLSLVSGKFLPKQQFFFILMFYQNLLVSFYADL